MVMKEYSGNIVVNDTEIILNSGEVIKIDSLIEKSKKRVFIENKKICNQTFSKLNNLRVTFINCYFENVTFDRCDLSDVGFKDNTILENCQFIKCDMERVSFFDSRIESCNFKSCKMIRINLEHIATIKDCLFDKCKMRDVGFPLPVFFDNKIIGKLSECTFYGKDGNLTPLICDLSEAVLDYVGFYYCDLSQTIRPKNENIIYVHNLYKCAQKAMDKIEHMEDKERKRVLTIFIRDWINEKNVDAFLDLDELRRDWEEYFDDVRYCLEI